MSFNAVPFKQKWQPQGDKASWDRQTGAPPGQFWWTTNQNEAGAYWGAIRAVVCRWPHFRVQLCGTWPKP
ncbi:MAG: hypothetical protein AB8B70_01460 [Prochlorococcus sp.]